MINKKIVGLLFLTALAVSELHGIGIGFGIGGRHGGVSIGVGSGYWGYGDGWYNDPYWGDYRYYDDYYWHPRYRTFYRYEGDIYTGLRPVETTVVYESPKKKIKKIKKRSSTKTEVKEKSDDGSSY